MLKQENLAANFCGLLARNGYKETPIEWRVLGQEQDGSLLASWIFLPEDGGADQNAGRSHVGIYNAAEKSFEILHQFPNRENVIQASVNASRTLLAYVIKTQKDQEDLDGGQAWVYTPHVVELKTAGRVAQLLDSERSKQVMVQFLSQKRAAFEKNYQDKLLVLIHEECIYSFTLTLRAATQERKIDVLEPTSWNLDVNGFVKEKIVGHFTWAQWDSSVQALYYIHLKPTMRSSLEKDDAKEKDPSTTTTLSAHQFHDNLPRETVVSSAVSIEY